MGWRDGSEDEDACCAMCKPGNPSSVPRSNVKVEGENNSIVAYVPTTYAHKHVHTPHKSTNKLLMHLKSDDRHIMKGSMF